MEPLQDPNRQIRLLRLCPGEQDDDIMLEMTVHDFDPLDDDGVSSNIVPYLAISYTWGESESPVAVFIDGKSQVVRWNCHYALWQARLHYAGSYVWIDSICIDQVNLSEKSQQVAIMGAIYQRAAQVLACIGPEADNSGIMLEHSYEFTNENLDRKEIRRILKTTKTEELEMFLAACEGFIGRPYWERLWVLQELMMARSKRILCGKHDVSFTIMPNMIALAIAVPTSNRLFRTMVFSTFRTIEELLSIGHERWRPTDRWLRELGRFKCTDLRDRVYGILNIFTWNRDTGLLVVPDYDKSVFHLAEEVIRAWDLSSTYEIYHLMRNLGVNMDDVHVKDHVSKRRLLGTPGLGTIIDTHYTSKLSYTQLRDDGHGRLTCCFERYGSAEDRELLNLIDKTIAVPQLSRTTPKYVYSQDKIMAVVTGDVRIGDYFANLMIFVEAYYLILRRSSDQTFEIIGQAVMVVSLPGFTYTNQCNCEEVGIVHDIQQSRFNTSLSVEDVIVLIAQDMIDPAVPQIDLVARLQRLYTRVSLQAHPMARIIDDSVHQD